LSHLQYSRTLLLILLQIRSHAIKDGSGVQTLPSSFALMQELWELIPHHQSKFTTWVQFGAWYQCFKPLEDPVEEVQEVRRL
jgi:hypothetical protein